MFVNKPLGSMEDVHLAVLSFVKKWHYLLKTKVEMSINHYFIILVAQQ